MDLGSGQQPRDLHAPRPGPAHGALRGGPVPRVGNPVRKRQQRRCRWVSDRSLFAPCGSAENNLLPGCPRIMVVFLHMPMSFIFLQVTAGVWSPATRWRCRCVRPTCSLSSAALAHPAARPALRLPCRSCARQALLSPASPAPLSRQLRCHPQHPPTSLAAYPFRAFRARVVRDSSLRP